MTETLKQKINELNKKQRFYSELLQDDVHSTPLERENARKDIYEVQEAIEKLLTGEDKK